MAPTPVTEDYYFVLGVQQSDSLETIVQAYRRLALKLYPDKNSKQDATQAFQLLGRAYETLKDASLRRHYDSVDYPRIKRNRSSPRPARNPRHPPGSSPASALSDSSQILVLQKAKQKRNAQWQAKEDHHRCHISKLRRIIQQLDQEIKNSDTVLVSQAAEAALLDGWVVWLFVLILRIVLGNEGAKQFQDAKELHERKGQETRGQREAQERNLHRTKVDIELTERRFRSEKEGKYAADQYDDRLIEIIERRIAARKAKQQERERERVEREKRDAKAKEQQQEKEKQEQQRRERMERAKRDAEARKQQQEQQEKKERVEKEELANRRKQHETWQQQSECAAREDLFARMRQRQQEQLEKDRMEGERLAQL